MASIGRDHIAIVGSGFAGLAMAVSLKQAGIEEFTIFEKAPRVGGVWRENTYPGAACDVESHLYSFSFAPHPGWTRQYAPQGEILAYLESVVARFDLQPHLRLATAVTAARWDDAEGHWELDTSDGRPHRARVVVAAGGGLTRPVRPSLPGLDRFAGRVFHSAEWDHTFPLAGKRVAVVGTGASAIQIVPAIAPTVGALHLYQRTAPWILPKRDRDILDGERARFARRPLVQRAARLGQYLRNELFALGFVVEPRILKLGQRQALRHLAASVPDPALRARLTPHFHMGCKRVLLSNDYYPALCRANVELVTDGIDQVRPGSILSRDGVDRPVDAIILATGFQAADVVPPFEIRGRGGLDLATAWRDGAEAYLGTSIAGFPNLFMVVGPNTGLGHSSMVLMMEALARYVRDAVKTMRARGWRSVEVRPEVQRRYNDEIQARLARTVWASGCQSWYQSSTGKNTTLWPGFTFEFAARTRRFDAAAYATEADSAARGLTLLQRARLVTGLDRRERVAS